MGVGILKLPKPLRVQVFGVKDFEFRVSGVWVTLSHYGEYFAGCRVSGVTRVSSGSAAPAIPRSAPDAFTIATCV